MVGIAQRMLNEASNENDVGVAVLKRHGIEQTVHTIKWNDGVQAGTVVIETADDRDYTGKWAPLQAVSFDGSDPAPKTDTVRLDGSYPVIRHRISEIVEGGTVTSRIDGNT